MFVLLQDELQGLLHGVQASFQDPRGAQQPERFAGQHAVTSAGKPHASTFTLPDAFSSINLTELQAQLSLCQFILKLMILSGSQIRFVHKWFCCIFDHQKAQSKNQTYYSKRDQNFWTK